MQVAEPSESDWQDWPRCPRCSRRRQAECPICQVAGTDFPLGEHPAMIPPPAPPGRPAAESPTTEQAEVDVLLICPCCDEAFAPRFYRYCQQCGHDFQAGLQVDVGGGEQLTPRALAVLATLVGIGLAMLLYFRYLLG